MKTLTLILLLATPAMAQEWIFSSHCPAQWVSCAQEVLNAQTAHHSCAYLLRYHGYQAQGIDGISETDARNGNLQSEIDCQAKVYACHAWLSWVQANVRACLDTLEQVR
jgi:hypothetical protein